MKSDSQELKKLLQFIAQGEVPEEDLNAFLINAYNILVIKSVVEAFPVESPFFIRGFFSGKKHRVLGENRSLLDLQKLLIERTKDPRVIMALSNAAGGSFKLLSDPVTSARTEKTLSQLAAKYVNDNSYIRILRNTDKILLTEDYKQAMPYIDTTAFILMLQEYTDHPKEKPSPDYPIDYFPVNRNLNILLREEE